MSFWNKVSDYFDLNKRAEAGEKERQERSNGKEKQEGIKKYVLIQWVEYSTDLDALIKKAEKLEKTSDKHAEIWKLGVMPEFDHGREYLDELAWD